MINNGAQIKAKNKKSFSDCFAQAEMELGMNVAVVHLSKSPKTKVEVMRTLASLGQHEFINLTRSYNEATISLAMYAGNGIVVKVIPETFLPRTEAIYHLPAILTRRVEAQGDDAYNFSIKAYPWLNGRKVDQNVIENLRSKLNETSLSYTNGDDHVGNIRVLPDQKGTIIGIDSNMYQGNDVEESLVTKWHEYIHRLYPVYDTALEVGNIPAQTEKTDFNAMTIHDTNSGLVSFDHFLNPEAEPAKEEKPTPTSFWDSLTSVLSFNP